MEPVATEPLGLEALDVRKRQQQPAAGHEPVDERLAEPPRIGDVFEDLPQRDEVVAIIGFEIADISDARDRRAGRQLPAVRRRFDTGDSTRARREHTAEELAVATPDIEHLPSGHWPAQA